VSVLQTGSIQIGMGLIVGASTNTVITGLVGTNSATFTGNISGTTLTVDSGSVTGTISIGMGVTGVGVASNTIITAGSALSWTVNNSQTVPAGTTFTGSSTNYTVNNSQTVALGTQFYGSMARWVEVKIIQKRGQIWYNPGVSTAADGKGLGKSNTVQAKFIAGEPTNAPE